MLHVVRRHRAFADGFPKAGPVSYEKKQLAAQQVAVAYGHRIELVVCFGALWYVLNGAGAPVLADKAALPGRVDTKGADFDMMGFLADEFSTTAMMVIRNVTVPGGGLRKITWGGGYDAPFIDLGSGKAAVVNPTTGTQSKNCDLPDDVPGVVALLRDMMDGDALPAQRSDSSAAAAAGGITTSIDGTVYGNFGCY